MKNNPYSFRPHLLLCWLLLGPFLGLAQPNSTRVYKIVNHDTGKVLDVSANGSTHHTATTSISMQNYTGSASQQWKFMLKRTIGSNVYEVINRSSGQVMTIVNPTANPYETVGQDIRNGYVNGIPTNTWQLWEMRRLTGISAISYEFALRGSGLLLSIDPYGSGWVFQNSVQSNGQVWDLVDVSPNPTANLDLGVYAITNVRSSYLMGTRSERYYQDIVTQNPDAGRAEQEWRFIPASVPGYFQIVNRVNQRALEIGGASLQELHNPGRQANLWDNWGGPNQTWGLFDIYDGHLLTLAEARDGRPCVLWNYHTNQCLEMGGGGSYPLQVGRIPNQWYYVGDTNQMWYIQYRAANRTTSPDPATTQTPATATDQLETTAAREQPSALATLALFPNPATATVAVSLTSPDGAEVRTVQVTDLRGAAVAGAVYHGGGQLDVAALAPGVYLVSVSDGARTYRQKLVKQ